MFFGSKIAILLSLGLHEGLPSGRRSLLPSKEISSTSKHEILSLFSFFVGHFCPPGSGSALGIRISVRIQPIKINADPDQQHCMLVFQNISTSKLIYHGLSNYGYTMIYIILSELVHLHKKIMQYL